MSQGTTQRVTLRFGQLRDALAAMMGMSLPVEYEAPEVTRARAALSERLANLKRLGFPPGVNVTKKAKVDYEATAIASLAIAAHLENMHLNPRVVIRALTGSDTAAWLFCAAALSCTEAKPATYQPAGALLLLFEPSGLDDLGTRAARAGRYDAPPSPTRIVHFDERAKPRVHGISVDAAVLGSSLATGLEAVDIIPAKVAEDLWFTVNGRRLGPAGTLAGYTENAGSLLSMLGDHSPDHEWAGEEILRALVLLNAMAAGGSEATLFANAPINPDHPMVTFRTALQAYIERVFLPVVQNNPQPLSLGMLELNDALGLTLDTEILPWLRRHLRSAGSLPV